MIQRSPFLRIALQVNPVVIHIGNSSYVLGHGVFAGDVCLATARTTTVLGDGHAGGKRRIPDNLRGELEKLRATA